jgi:hypothetical protein
MRRQWEAIPETERGAVDEASRDVRVKRRAIARRGVAMRGAQAQTWGEY